MTKKFGKVLNTWVLYGSFLLDQNSQDEMHEILAKALNILPKREHIELVKNLLNWNSRKVIQNKVDHYLKV